MKVAFSQEELQLLTKILQDQLLTTIPSGEVFQVKCAVKNDEIMILTQHPSGLEFDSQTIFDVLTEALQGQPNYQSQEVKFFLRVTGEKLPYAKHSLIVEPPHRFGDDQQVKDRASFPEPENDGQIFSPPPPPPLIPDLESPFTDNSITDNPFMDNPYSDDYSIRDNPYSYNDPISNYSSTDEKEMEEAFDPLAGTPDLLVSRRTIPIKQILLAVGLGGIVIMGAGAYFLTAPCVLSECQELETAERLKSTSPQLIRSAKSAKDLLKVQQQLETASAELTKIPVWASRHQQAEELSNHLSTQANKLNSVAKALQTASSLAKNQTPAKNLAELQNRQRAWRQAIIPLEAIRPNNELYDLVAEKLLNYRLSLQVVNQQLHQQEIWQKKLTSAKAVAAEATKRESTAKSGSEWQKVASIWQVVVNALNTVPQTSSEYETAQKLVLEYKPKLVNAQNQAKKELLGSQNYQKALSAANQAKAWEKQKQWQAAVTSWNQALQFVKQIPADSSDYSQVQTLVPSYSTGLQQAQEKQKLFGGVDKAKADLQKTCVNSSRFCTFTVDNQGIIVRLTPDYDRILKKSQTDTSIPSQNSGTDINGHFQTLQEALKVISENSGLALVLYDSSGQELYLRQP